MIECNGKENIGSFWLFVGNLFVIFVFGKVGVIEIKVI